MAAMALWPAALRAELPSAEITERVSRSVYQVQARDCPGSDRSGTGFVWQRAEWVVTALHVVADCRAISVYSETLGVVRDAALDRALLDADLALLVVGAAPDLPPLPVAAADPALHEDLLALGYHLGSPTMGNKNLKVAYGSTALEDLLPEAVRREIAAVGSPSLSLEILRLEGHLLPGLSGAPLVDGEGRLRAIGDGGLERGAASISWALPVRHLERLETSERVEVALGAAAAGLFAADLESRAGGKVQCGEISLTRVRSRPLDELAESSDDPVGLLQLAAVAGFAGIEFDRFAFDIYQDLDGGGIVAVPSGAALEGGADGCRVDDSDGAIEPLIRGFPVASVEEAQLRSQQFEEAVAADLPYQWVVDPQWSYPMPSPRFDGMLVNRRSYLGIDPSLFAPAAYAFENLMTRHDTFIGAVAINHAYDPEAFTYCQLDPSMPECAAIAAHTNRWLSFVFGVFLSTYPIG